jgi:hypothetical protein
MQGAPPPPSFGPPTGSGTNPGAPPPWQQAGQGVPQGPPRRIYPDAMGGPSTVSTFPQAF